LEKTEAIVAYGHRLVKSTHRTTFEITKEKHLTEEGDCIIAVNASKAVADLSSEFKELARRPNAKIVITIEAGAEKETIRASGDPRLTFSHPTDLVVRMSGYVCSRTLAVKANKAAADLSRSLVKELRKPERIVNMTLAVKISDQ